MVTYDGVVQFKGNEREVYGALVSLNDDDFLSSHEKSLEGRLDGIPNDYTSAESVEEIFQSMGFDTNSTDTGFTFSYEGEAGDELMFFKMVARYAHIEIQGNVDGQQVTWKDEGVSLRRVV